MLSAFEEGRTYIGIVPDVRFNSCILIFLNKILINLIRFLCFCFYFRFDPLHGMRKVKAVNEFSKIGNEFYVLNILIMKRQEKTQSEMCNIITK